ncbi:MAG: hypothetical protein ABS76_26840 [Pelagibacterium sp. SCN 64-44]|nr:MAG: hypothetical protein ABS76_26840 [Pelagibacterium sp. SCN 64-44]
MSAYFFWMMLASALGFGKMLALAQILHPANFGAYVSLFGLATLAGMILSFGQVEATTKHFPRLWAVGEKREIPRHARRIALSQAARFVALGLIAAILAGMVDLGFDPLFALVTAALGLATSLLALMASIFRASENIRALQNFTVVRSLLALIASCAGGFAFGWQGALLGDVVASAFSLAFATLQARVLIRASEDTPHTTIAEPLEANGGKRLYAANILSSSISLVDRSLVNLALGAAAAGTYGVIALLYQVGQITMGILTQRVGPLIIKAKFTGSNTVSGLAIFRKALLGQAVLALGLILGMFLLQRLGFPPGFFEKYSISALAILLAGGISLMQIYQLLEFVLISKDLEHAVLTASGASSMVFAVGCLLAWRFGLSVEGFVAAVFLARLVQVGLLLHAILANPNARPVPADER